MSISTDPNAAANPVPLVTLLGVENILTSDTSITNVPDGLCSTIVNQSSCHFVNLPELVDRMELPRIPICRPAMMRLLCNPPTSVETVEERRKLLAAFRTNGRLRRAVDTIETLLVKEQSTLLTGYEEMIGIFSLKSMANHKVETLFQDITNFLRSFLFFMPEIGRGRAHYDKIMSSISSLGESDSPTLKKLSKAAQSLSSSEDYKYINRFLWLTFRNILRPGEDPKFTPRLPMTPGSLDYYSGLGFLCGLGASLFSLEMNKMSSTFNLEHPDMVFQAVIVPACLLIASALPKILSSRGGERFIKAVSKSSLAAGFDLIGELLALKALADFDRRTEVMGWKHPDLIESPGYRMEAKGLRHPLLELKGTSVVPNDVKIDAGTPTVITGINSGGKSTLVTSIFLNQLLLQNGLRIPVDSASVAIADRLHYRGPLFNGLDEEGRYGAELKDTKTALTSSTRRSLVIFDEICGGTSDNERLDISYAVIEAMRTMEISTLLVTHDRVLAQRLADNNLAKPITFGLGETGDPDYIVRDGIGKSSYADRIARKLQFTPSDIRRYAEENRV